MSSGIGHFEQLDEMSDSATSADVGGVYAEDHGGKLAFREDD